MRVIVNIGKRENGSTFVSYDHIKGNHWPCFTLDIFEKVLFYGDSIRWPFPKIMITVTSKMFEAISSLFQVELSLSAAQVYDHKFISNFLFQGHNFYVCGVAAIFTAIMFTDPSLTACIMATREFQNVSPG